MTGICLATEDALSEAVVDRLVAEVNHGLEVVVRIGRKGNEFLKKKLPELCAWSKSTPVVLVTDLDRGECPLRLILEWAHGASLPHRLLFRVAVREVEAWLLADREAFSEFVGAPINKVPLHPEILDTPKQTLLGLVRRYGRRQLKNELLPAPGSLAPVGLGYNSVLIDYVNNSWSPQRASMNADSLARAQIRLHELGSNVNG